MRGAGELGSRDGAVLRAKPGVEGQTGRWGPNRALRAKQGVEGQTRCCAVHAVVQGVVDCWRGGLE